MIVFFALLSVGLALKTEYQCEEENWQYQKTLTGTHSGISCQRWDSQSPHEHGFTSDDFPDETISDAGNFCRNPDDEPSAWCYTVSVDTRWDFCDILNCMDEQISTEVNTGKHVNTVTMAARYSDQGKEEISYPTEMNPEKQGYTMTTMKMTTRHSDKGETEISYPTEMNPEKQGNTMTTMKMTTRQADKGQTKISYPTEMNPEKEGNTMTTMKTTSRHSNEENATEIGPDKHSTTMTTREMTAGHSKKGQGGMSYPTEMNSVMPESTMTTTRITTMYSDKGQEGGAEVLVPNLVVISASFLAMMCLE